MAKFGINDILNSTKAAHGQTAGNDFREIWLDPYEVKPSDSNFYSLDNIEELADSILTAGQQQPTVLGLVNGEYRIVNGHRRNLANIMNIERGHMQHRKIRYLYKEMTEAAFELSLLIGNAYNRELTAWEKTQQAQKLKEALLKAKKEDGLEITGKLRDLVADLMNESSTNIARMDTIQKNAVPEVKEEFKKGNLGISAAYEASRLPSEIQKDIAAKAGTEGIRAKEISGMKQKKSTPGTCQDAKKANTRNPRPLQVHNESSIKNKENTNALPDTASNAQQKASDSDTLKSGWNSTNQTVFTIKALLQYADRITADDLCLLHNILIRYQNTEAVP